MKLNYETCVVGNKCVLVPYRPEHVPKYHQWMLDPFLLEMTGSEPLSLAEEVAMQQAWRDDDEKCTFIVLAKDQCDFGDFDPENDCSCSNNTNGSKTFDDPDFCRRNISAMVGDVNLFFSEEEEEDEQEDDGSKAAANSTESTQKKQQPLQLHAELDIMIAEDSCRGQGLGKEASCLMMLYGAKHKNIRRFFCKIKEGNKASLGLFQKSLGFQQCAYAACFQEYELERKCETAREMLEGISTALKQLTLSGADNPFEWKTFSCSQRNGV